MEHPIILHFLWLTTTQKGGWCSFADWQSYGTPMGFSFWWATWPGLTFQLLGIMLVVDFVIDMYSPSGLSPASFSTHSVSWEDIPFKVLRRVHGILGVTEKAFKLYAPLTVLQPLPWSRCGKKEPDVVMGVHMYVPATARQWPLWSSHTVLFETRYTFVTCKPTYLDNNLAVTKYLLFSGQRRRQIHIRSSLRSSSSIWHDLRFPSSHIGYFFV